jgi:hypothetical protein
MGVSGADSLTPIERECKQTRAPGHTKPEPVPEPAPKLPNDTSSPNLDRNQPSVANPFINPEKLSRVPAATDRVFDAVLDKANSIRLSFSQIDASLGGVAEVSKRPNFIEFYEISRSVHSDKARFLRPTACCLNSTLECLALSSAYTSPMWDNP